MKNHCYSFECISNPVFFTSMFTNKEMTPDNQWSSVSIVNAHVHTCVLVHVPSKIKLTISFDYCEKNICFNRK